MNKRLVEVVLVLGKTYTSEPREKAVGNLTVSYAEVKETEKLYKIVKKEGSHAFQYRSQFYKSELGYLNEEHHTYKLVVKIVALDTGEGHTKDLIESVKNRARSTLARQLQITKDWADLVEGL